MKIQFALTAVIVLLWSSVFGQYQYRYATPHYDWARALDADPKEGYIVASNVLKNTWQPHLMRVDKYGSILWSKTYEQPGIDEHFFDVTVTDWSDRSIYAALGQADGVASLGTGADDYFVIADEKGNPMYVKRYLTKETDIGVHVEPIVHRQYGKGYVIAGYTYHNLSTRDKDIHVIITDSKGNIIQSAVYLYPLNQDTKWIEATKDGGFLVTGTTQGNCECDEDNTNIFVMKLDPLLNVLWFRTYDIFDTDESYNGTKDNAYVVKEDEQGDIHIAGTIRFLKDSTYHHDEPFQLHLYGNGNIQWLKSYEVKSYPSAEAVTMLDDVVNTTRNYILAGRAHQPFEALMFATDKMGDMLWAKTYPTDYPTSSNFAEDLTKNHIKGYSFTGRNFDGSPPSNSYDIQVLEATGTGKTDAPCEKEVEIIVHPRRHCESTLPLRAIKEMRELDIPVDPIEIQLEIFKCDDSANNLIEQSHGLVSPNPAENSIYIEGFGDGVEVLIYDLQGILKKKSSLDSAGNVSVADLPTGIYVIKVTDAAGAMHQMRMVKK